MMRDAMSKARRRGRFFREAQVWALFVAAILSIGCSGCAGDGNLSNENNDAVSMMENEGAAVETAEPNTKKENGLFQQAKTYESVLNEYTDKLQSATPNLIEEYNLEAANNDKGLEGLAEIANNKVEDLAEIVNEGVQEMAEVMYTSGSGKYEEYEDWATKLYDVYEVEATKIYDAYTNSIV